MGRKVFLFGRIVAVAAGSVGLAAVCNAQVPNPASPPGWLMFSSAPLNSQPTAFAPAKAEQPVASADASASERRSGSPNKEVNLDPLAADDLAPPAASRPSAKRAGSGHAFDGGLHLGDPSLHFETETKIQNAPLRYESDMGFGDGNQRSAPRIPFIGLSIVSPIN